MDFPRLTKKERLANAALIAVGTVGVWLGSAPRGHGAWQPIEFVFGVAFILCGVVATVATRWQPALVILALFAAPPGAFAGDSFWSFRHPDFHPRGGKHPDARTRMAFEEQQTYNKAGALLAVLSVPLAAAAVSAIRKPDD